LGRRGIRLDLEIYSPSIEELQAQRTYWATRSTLEQIAALLVEHNDASRVGSVEFEHEEKLWAYLVFDDLWGGA
jgi:hypothetical protein